MMTKTLAIVSLTALSALAVSAAPEVFDFKDPKGVNNVAFSLDATLETITGTASGVTGAVTFDPENPGAAAGKIVVATSTMTLPNPMQRGHMLSDKWLDAASNPQITFETRSLANVKTDGDVTTADVTGLFTLKGVSKEITVPVKFTYLKDKLGARLPNAQGDLLVLRANFPISRGDYNINPGKFDDKVAEQINISFAIAGACPRR